MKFMKFSNFIPAIWGHMVATVEQRGVLVNVSLKRSAIAVICHARNAIKLNNASQLAVRFQTQQMIFFNASSI